MVYNLSSSFPDDSKPSRKRKCSHSDEIGGSFLTPAVSHSSIVLNPHTEDWNCNLNNSNTFLKSFLSMRHSTRRGFASHSPSPIPFDMRGDSDVPPLAKMPHVGELPKIGRPRSKSTAERPKKKITVHSRSKSIEQSASNSATPGVTGAATLTCIPLDTSKLNLNTNNSNSTESSPTQLLSIPYTRFRPLPITPPRNPFEDSCQKLNPKTLKQLQRK